MRRFALILALIGAPLAHGADLYVGPGQTYTSITDAVNNSTNGDVIWIEPGVYSESIDLGARQLTFRADGGVVSWSGSTGTSILSGAGGSVALHGIAFEGGLTHRALDMSAGIDVLVEDCSFGNHSTTEAGGAIRLQNTPSAIRRSTFSGNGVDSLTTGLGGAVRLLGGAHQMEDCFFTGNAALGPSGRGGAVYGSQADLDLTVIRSTFAFNDATTTGGAVEVANGILRVEESVFQGNDAGSAGAIRCDQTAGCQILDSEVRDHSVTGNGGGIELYYGAGNQVRRNLFCANDAVGSGGALYAWGASALVENNVFADGLATHGGAIATTESGTLTSENNTYVSNEASLDGAAINILYQGVLTSNNDLVAWNTAAAGYAGTAVATWYPTTFTYDHFFTNALGNTDGTIGTGSTTGTDPTLTDWPAGTCTWASFVPLGGSPLVDTGDPALADPDATVSDRGAFGGPGAPVERVTDQDGDGYVAWEDCDDTDATVNPNATEVCDGGATDEDCDGLIDNDDPSVTGVVPTWPDVDGDGYGDATAQPTDACLTGDRVDNDLDCFDDNPLAWEPLTFYTDADNDGLGDASAPVSACTEPPGTAPNPDDCDDTQPAIGGPTAWYPDADGDGEGSVEGEVLACTRPPDHEASDTDCDDGDPTIYLAAQEVCDGVDNDCDLLVDDLDPSNDPTSAAEWWPDGDGDGVGAGQSIIQCSPPADHAPVDGDCDDADGTVYPGAPEYCDGVDNDCNNLPDDSPVDPITWYVDGDGDGYGSDGSRQTNCEPLPDAVYLGGDCDDTDLTSFPGGTEVCDGADNDCNGSVDDDPTNGSTWYPDVDGDGHGTDEGDVDVVEACSQPAGHAASDDDCDDNTADTYPNAPELCDRADNDCDGTVDEGLPLSLWYPDADGDGYGEAGAPSEEACGPFEGRVDNDADCDDTDPAIRPDGTDLPANGIDEDCDGQDTPGDSTREPRLPDGEEPDGPKGSTGCSCTTGSPLGPAGLVWLLPALAFARRRRTT